MFIIKFNNMIRNKWIWGVFATIVALAFTVSDISCFSRSAGSDENGVGSLNGKPVPIADYGFFRKAISLESERERIASPERETWKRLAALETAKKAGIEIPDSIVRSAVRNDQTFRDETGAFNKQYYRFILNSRGITPREYEEIVRRRIAVSIAEQLASTAAFLAPAVVDNRLKGFTDSFTLRTATLTNSHFRADISLTDDEIRKYFEVNQEEYREPERRRVVYSAFKSSDFLSEVVVEEDEIADYYDVNAAQYTTFGTNGVETVRSLEEVRAEIESELAKVASKEAALRRASEFADVFYTTRNPDLTFEQAAADFGCVAVTSRLFSVGGSPVIYSASPAFVEAAFDLGAEGPDRFSDAVDGGEESYVISFFESIPSNIPDFESVKQRVQARAVESKLSELFLTDVETASKAFTAGKDEGKDFATIAAAQNLELGTNFVFSHMDAFRGDSIPNAQEIAIAVSRMDAGEFSAEPIVNPKEALFVEVAAREPGDQMLAQSIKRQIIYGAQQELAEILLDDWREKNLVSMKPQPKRSIDNEDAPYTEID